MSRKVCIVMAAAAALLLSACAHKPPQPSGPGNTAVQQPGAGPETSGAGGANVGQSAGAVNPGGPGVAGPQEGLLAKRAVYFDFDSSEIKGEGVDIVAAHAKYLAAHPTLHVRLEGNTDERGSREYNIGLGERRAQSVRQAMLLQGVSDAQITTVSYGAERPVDPGHDEAAWAKNRRVDIVYLN
ncbi:MAG TPA: peptidoglycan-associated lipoprotein Pal [Steroidobacteraceae bacterium]|nr:peptidoglycan-associated lipoprotein Pal [Steroidobacteraceae bacterium]